MWDLWKGSGIVFGETEGLSISIVSRNMSVDIMSARSKEEVLAHRGCEVGGRPRKGKNNHKVFVFVGGGRRKAD